MRVVVVRDDLAGHAFGFIAGSRPDAHALGLRDTLRRALDGMLEALGRGRCFVVGVTLVRRGTSRGFRITEAGTDGQTERNTVNEPAHCTTEAGTGRRRLGTE